MGLKAGVVGSARQLIIMAPWWPDTCARFDHLRASDHGAIAAGGFMGTRDGRAFAIPLISVIALDQQGKIVRNDFYEVDKIDEARACLEVLRPAPLHTNDQCRVFRSRAA